MKRTPSWLTWLCATCLILGIFPSLTALSATLFELAPGLARYSGPINLFKLSLPVLVAYVWLNRTGLPRLILHLLLGALVLGSLSTWIAAWRCGFEAPTVVREWLVMIAGMIGAMALFLLPSRQQRWVLGGWATTVGALIALDFLAPAWIDWFYENLFDPTTRAFDAKATGHRLLTGVFGSQSMAKILSWLPWIALAFSRRAQSDRRGQILWFVLATASTGLILATSQRGPFLGALAGWVALAIHRYFRFGDRRSVAVVGICVFASLLLTLAIVPRDLLEARYKSLMGVNDPSDKTLLAANENVWFRQFMFRFTLHKIAEHPLGDACTPAEEYPQWGIYVAHSHHLYLQQFRDRGWAWGAYHALLWILALVFAWRSRAPASSAIVAAVVCISVQGMFDQPWFVLNHALLLSVVVLQGLSLRSPASEAKA